MKEFRKFQKILESKILSQSLKPLDFPGNIFRLDNGLTVIHHHLPTTPVIVTDVWVQAGARVEPQEWTGMAHFLEHMIFKGTDHIQPGVFDHVIESTGGMTNAATSHDYARFFITTAAPYLKDTLPCLADLLLHATIPEDEFEREREVVIEELYTCYDDPDWLGFQSLCQNLYQYHPYGRSILGEEDQLRTYSPQQMRCFHQTHYQPENMTVVIAGGIEQEAALSLVHETFKNFNSPGNCPLISVDAEPPLVNIRRQELQLPRLEQARLHMAWLGPGVEKLKDAFALDMLSVILSGGRSSRLVRELREEKQWVFEISSEFSLQKDSSLFTVSAWLETEYRQTVEAVIRDRIYQLQTTPVTEAEITRCKRLLCNDYAFSTETPSQLAGLYGYYNTIAQAELSVTYLQEIKTMKTTDLQRVAKQYLSPERYAITTLQPMC